MKTVFLLISCVVFASVVRASEVSDEDPTEIVDGKPVGDKEGVQDPAGTIDGVPEGDAEDPQPVVIGGVEQSGDSPAEDSKKEEDELMDEKEKEDSAGAAADEDAPEEKNEDNKKEDDELTEENDKEDSAGKAADEDAPEEKNEDIPNGQDEPMKEKKQEAPVQKSEDTPKQEDALIEEMDKEAPAENSKKVYLVNGEELGENDFEKDVPVIDGEIQETEGREMDELAEDSAPFGWRKINSSWCTISGRKFLSGKKGVRQTFAQCAKLCENRSGCKAIEMWFNYNWNCYWCKKPSLIQPYTNKKDLAYPVHVWVQRRKPIPPPSPPDVKVTCGKNVMSISIPKYRLPGLDREHLRLSDVKCGAIETRTRYILRTRLTKCRTVSRHTKNFVCYMNKVEEIPLKKYQIITRVREVEIPFSCYYSNMGVVSAIGLRVKSKKIVFSKKGFGKFVLVMNIYPNPRFSLPYKKFPVWVPLRKMLFVSLHVDSNDRKLAILAINCWATPNSSPRSKGLRYTFIRNGCAVDKTVKFLPTADKRYQRFKIEAFSFVGDHQFVYMHCKVMVCKAGDRRSRCAKGCIGRGKRSLMTQESNDEEVDLSQGPFMRGEEEETKLEKTAQDMRNVKKSSMFPTLVAAMAVVAAVCVMGVSYFAWNKKKQNAVRDYQRLTVAAED